MCILFAIILLDLVIRLFSLMTMPPSETLGIFLLVRAVLSLALNLMIIACIVSAVSILILVLSVILICVL